MKITKFFSLFCIRLLLLWSQLLQSFEDDSLVSTVSWNSVFLPYFKPTMVGAVVYWLAHGISDLKIGGSTPRAPQFWLGNNIHSAGIAPWICSCFFLLAPDEDIFSRVYIFTLMRRYGSFWMGVAIMISETRRTSGSAYLWKRVIWSLSL